VTTLGEAFIEVHADTGPFDRELAAKLKAALADADKKLSPMAVDTGEKLSKKISEGVDGNSPAIERAFRRVGNKIGSETDKWDAKLKAPFMRMAKGNFILTRMFGQMVIAIGGATRRIFRFGTVVTKTGTSLLEFAAITGKLVVQSLGRMVGIASDVAGTMSSLAAAGTKVGSSFLALGGELVALIPTLLANVTMVLLLTAALGALLGAIILILAPIATLIGFLTVIPTLVGLILFAVAPLIIGFKGLGDAMQLVFEKDPEVLKKKLKTISPVLRQLVMALRPIRTEFDKMKDAVQAALLGPIITQLSPFLRTLLPVLQVGFTAIAQAMGNIALALMRVLTSREALDGMAAIMGALAQFLDQNSGVITDLITALGRAAVTALPIVMEMLNKLGEFLDEFAGWIEGAITDGRFEGWLNTAIESLKSIGGLIGSAIELFKTLFGMTDEEGRKFLDKISRALDKITAWLKSPEGIDAVRDLVSLANLFADALGIALQFLRLSLTTLHLIMEAFRWLNDHPIGKVDIGKTLVGPLAFFSGGGVVPQDELAMVHKGEPILDPANSVSRNRAILANAGMLDTLSPQESTVVNVYLGTERLDERVDYRIAKSNNRMANSLATGTRSF
jgi:hypothetical protein